MSTVNQKSLAVYRLNASVTTAVGSANVSFSGNFTGVALIVVDDGSADGSPEIASGYARRDRRVRHIALQRDPSTTSGARASNVGIGLAQGDYIARMDADDIAVPGRLALQLELMRRRQVDVCGGRAMMFQRKADRRFRG